MSKFKDLVEYENAKPDRSIRLVRSGTFYRAYNRSAWIFSSLISQYTVLREYVKELKDNVFYIGFPTHVMIDRIAGRKYDKTEKGYDVMLNEDDVLDETGYEAWCASILTETKDKEGEERTGNVRFSGHKALENYVASKISRFPLMDSTPKQCLDFLFDLQQLLRQNKYDSTTQ